MSKVWANEVYDRVLKEKITPENIRLVGSAASLGVELLSALDREEVIYEELLRLREGVKELIEEFDGSTPYNSTRIGRYFLAEDIAGFFQRLDALVYQEDSKEVSDEDV